MSTARRLIPCALGLVVLTAGVAGAHATLDKKTATADSVIALTLKIPNEHEPAYTTKVTLEVPAGFTETACGADEGGWTCQVAEDTSQGRSAVVTWTYPGAVESDKKTLLFRTRTPNANGEFAFEVAQTYSSGVKDFWDGPAGSDTPAPRLTVTGAVAKPSPTVVATTEAPAPTDAATPVPTLEATPTDGDDDFPWLPVALSGVAVLAGLGFFVAKRR